MGGGSKQSSSQQTYPGTLSPVTASLLSLFGGQPVASGGQFIPTAFGGAGSSFTPQSFGALPGLLQNIPQTGTEQFLTSPDFQSMALGQIGAGQGLLSQGASTLGGLLGGPEAT